jgi:hypothetical protein
MNAVVSVLVIVKGKKRDKDSFKLENLDFHLDKGG